MTFTKTTRQAAYDTADEFTRRVRGDSTVFAIICWQLPDTHDVLIHARLPVFSFHRSTEGVELSGRAMVSRRRFAFRGDGAGHADPAPGSPPGHDRRRSGGRVAGTRRAVIAVKAGAAGELLFRKAA